MKRITLFVLLASVSMVMLAQATDLVVDNQNPGWLSNVISFSDQQTVKNLKVTGYVNETDLKFIGTLIENRSLDGRLDISEVEIISESGRESDNTMSINAFQLSNQNPIKTLKYLIFPEKLSSSYAPLSIDVGGGRPAAILHVDTLYFNWSHSHVTGYDIGGSVSTLYLGTNIDSIPDEQYNSHWTVSSTMEGIHNLETCILSKNMRYLGYGAFSHIKTLTNINFNELTELEYLGPFAFRGNNFVEGSFLPDTLIIPTKITTFCSGAFGYRKGQHIYFHENIESITYAQYNGYSTKYGLGNGNGLFLHMRSLTPPSLYSNLSAGCVVYVPKGAKELYLKDNHWKEATIIEENPLETVLLDKHSASMEVGETLRLIPTFIPSDADDKTLEWSVKDESVAKVENGVVTALAPGKTWVYAMSVVEDVMDSCEVTVIQHVTNITFDTPALTIEGIGATAQLNVIVTPEDATDKSVTWTSSNPSVCVVSNGKIVSVGYGMSVVIATSVDGGHMAVATVNVSEATNVKAAETSDISIQGTSFGVRILNAANETANIYTPDGVLVKAVKVTGAQMNVELPEGSIYLVKIADKTVKVSR